MTNEKDTLVKQTATHSNPHAARPEDFEVVSDGVPFHGQSGASEAEHKKLMKADDHGKSRFGKKALPDNFPRGPRRSSPVEPSYT